MFRTGTVIAVVALVLTVHATVHRRADPPTTVPLPSGEETTLRGRFVMAFQVNRSNWVTYNWEGLTHLMLFDGIDPAMLPVAEKHGVVLALHANCDVALLTAPDANKTAWIDAQVNAVVNASVSGINVDFESPLEKDSNATKGFTDLMRRLGEALRPAVRATGRTPHFSYDAAWSPAGIDGRYYDYKALGEIFDYTIIMDYDTRSQVFTSGPCLAGANAPRSTVLDGVKGFLDVGVPAAKLVLGVPFYGYDYPCIGGEVVADPSKAGGTCEITRVPFRGCNCSDAAGSQYGINYWGLIPSGYYPDKRITSAVVTNASTLSTTFNYIDTTTNQTHQYWVDDAVTLGAKFALAAEMGLGGISMWEVDYLQTPVASLLPMMNAVWDQMVFYRTTKP
jgi:di-N-acetylchitobiase